MFPRTRKPRTVSAGIELCSKIHDTVQVAAEKDLVSVQPRQVRKELIKATQERAKVNKIHEQKVGDNDDVLPAVLIPSPLSDGNQAAEENQARKRAVRHCHICHRGPFQRCVFLNRVCMHAC